MFSKEGAKDYWNIPRLVLNRVISCRGVTGLQKQLFLMVLLALTMVILSLMSFPVGEVTMDKTASQSEVKTTV